MVTEDLHISRKSSTFAVGIIYNDKRLEYYDYRGHQETDCG